MGCGACHSPFFMEKQMEKNGISFSRIFVVLMRIICFIILLSTYPVALVAQGAMPVESTLSDEAWEAATENLDYSKDIQRKKEPPPTPDYEVPNFDFTGIGTFFQVLVICLGVGLLGWAVYFFVQQPTNKRIQGQGTVTIENLEEHLEESDLERFLREALEQERYSDALRIHFLQIIKSLNEKGHIKWAKDKTNRNYLQELSQSPFFAAMRQQTRIYEKVWYGNMRVDGALYATLAPDFEALHRRIG